MLNQLIKGLLICWLCITTGVIGYGSGHISGMLDRPHIASQYVTYHLKGTHYEL